MSPTRRPCSSLKPLRASTSTPLSTSACSGASAPPSSAFRASLTPEVNFASPASMFWTYCVCSSWARATVAASVTALAATLATRARKGPTSPLPSGWTRFERKTTKVSLAGSTQIEVPVKPVWPKEPAGKRSPRLDENVVLTSQPRPRAPPSSVTCRGRVISETPSGERMRTPLYSPPFRIIWQKTARSSAVEKRPA